MKKILRIVFLLLICIQPLCAAQYINVNSVKDLTLQSVISISQDPLKRMWFGTTEGLMIYDGNTVKTYKGNIITPDGKRIWLGNYISHLTKEKKAQSNNYIIADQNLFCANLIKNQYNQLTTGNNTQTMTLFNQELWYIQENLLKTYNPQKNQHKLITSLPADTYNCIIIDKDYIYIGSKSGLSILNKDMTIHSVLLKGKNVFKLFKSSKNELWIAMSNDGLYRYANNQLINITQDIQPPKGVGTKQVRDIIEDSDGNIWIATSIGIVKYDTTQHSYSYPGMLHELKQINSTSVYCLYLDNYANLWAGLYDGGVQYLFLPKKGKVLLNNNVSRIQLHDIFPPRNYLQNICNLVEDKHENLWFTTNKEGIYCMNTNREIIKCLNINSFPSIVSSSINDMLYDDSKNLLYIAHHMGGLSIYDINKDKISFFPLPNINFIEDHNNSIYHLELWKGNLYLSTPRSIYAFNLETKSFSHITEIGDYGTDFKINDEGLLFIRQKKSVQIITLRDPSINYKVSLQGAGYFADISQILASSKGFYLFTLGEGVLHYNLKDSTFTCHNTENSKIPSNYCYKAHFTNNGKIVISHDYFVSLYNPKEESYTSLEKLDRRTPANQNGMFVNKKNDIFLGGISEYYIIKEKALTDNITKVPAVYLNELYVNNKLIQPDQHQQILSTKLAFNKGIKLKPNQNNITVTFTHTNYQNISYKQEFAYMLIGLDKEWNLTTGLAARYTNLSPGDYTLIVKFNQKNAPYTYLNFHIDTPLYATWWAICIYILGSIFIVFIVYKYKVRQHELALSLKSEQNEKKQIERLNNDKLTFFTNVSHEFRTPLTLIITQVDSLLTQTNMPSSIYNSIYKLKKNAQYMNNLVSELLDFRKFTQDKFTLYISQEDLHGFIKETYLTFIDLARQKGITFTLHGIETETLGWYDSKALEKVLFNLLSNAFKYTPQHGEIALSFTKENHSAIIKVTDNGTGIKNKDQANIFNRFYQGENQEGQTLSPGTGIGLALTKAIIEKHHGSISVESEEGKGSTFTVIIPLDKCTYENDKHIICIDRKDDMQGKTEQNHDNKKILTPVIDWTEEIDSNKSVNKHEDGSKKTILLVEDNTDILIELKKIFEDRFNVILAGNGQEGLDKTIEFRPDLIISDIMMPKMSGTELCIKIKNNIDLCHIPIILLTALTGFDHNIEGLNRGADDYITKPFNRELLIARVNNLLRNRILIQNQLNKNLVSEIDLTSVDLLDQELLKKVEEIILKNLDNTSLSINDLYEEVNMGRTNFFAKFKELTGTTPNNFILNYRMKYAANQLIQQSNLSISEISDLCGFGSAEYFSRSFKKQYGITPLAYRNKKLGQ